MSDPRPPRTDMNLSTVQCRGCRGQIGRNLAVPAKKVATGGVRGWYCPRCRDHRNRLLGGTGKGKAS